jgi:hypothetical protein
MTTLYTVLEVLALLAVIIIPLGGPQKKPAKTPHQISNILVNEEGYLEYAVDHDTDQHHPVL